MPSLLNDFRYLIYSATNDNEDFIKQLNKELSSIVQRSPILDENEPERLLRKNEYDAAVISVFRLLEISLRKYNNFFSKGTFRSTPMALT